MPTAQVYVRYCSSDAWMGNTAMWEEQFRGAPTVYAVFRDLMATQGLAAGAKLLFGGCSAGARGAMVHLDNVVAMLAQEGIEARGLLDSGLWVDFPPITDTGMAGTLLNQAEDVYGFANVSSVISADCAAAYPNQEWMCLFGQYRMPFVQSDYFVSMSQFDGARRGKRIRSRNACLLLRGLTLRAPFLCTRSPRFSDEL